MSKQKILVDDCQSQWFSGWLFVFGVVALVSLLAFAVSHPIEEKIAITAEEVQAVKVSLRSVSLLFFFALTLWGADRLWSSGYLYRRKLNAAWVLLGELASSEQVQALLTENARKLHEVFESQTALLSGDIEVREARLDDLNKSVKKAKEEFWKLHDAARALGYETRSSYKDYLV